MTTALAVQDRRLERGFYAPRLPARVRDDGRDPMGRDFLSWTRLLGVRLRDARAEIGWTIFQLARETGVACTTLRSYERGDVIPPIRALYLVARSLGIDPRELLP